MLKEIIGSKENIIRFVFPMFISYLVSIKCKMDKNSGSSVKFRPPGYIFGIVWPILFTLIGLSWVNSANKLKSRISDILYLSLSLLLASWIIVYSCMKDKKNAVYILFLTLLSITFLMLYVPQNSKLLLAPLGIWVLYATFLNTTEVQNS